MRAWPYDWQPFPTDEMTLTLLEAACNINPDTGHTELQRFLDIGTVVKSVTHDETGGVFSDVESAAEAWDGDEAPTFFVEYEPGSAPHSPHSVIVSLIAEIRRLRELEGGGTE